MSICRGFGCLRGGGERGGRGERRKMKEQEGKRRREKRRREGEVNRVWVDEDVKISFVLIIDHHLPTNKMPLFPIQQYPSLMKNSPDPVWYSTP